MERSARLRVLVPAAAACLAALAGSTAGAAVHRTRAEALDRAFPGARIERRSVFLTAAEATAVERRARAKLASRLVAPHLAWRGDTLQGAAFFDARIVRTMPAVLMVVVAPDSVVSRVEVLAFHEPSDYEPPARWLDRLGSRRLDNRLWPGRDIHNLSGATLTVRSVVESVRTALALYELVVAPRARTGAGK